MARRGSNRPVLPSIDSLLHNLPNENDDDYTIKLKKVVLDNNLLNRENDVENYLKDVNSNKRFSAFYALLIICREFNNYSRYNTYVDTYANEFQQYELYKIIMSTYFRNKGILGEKSEYIRAVRFAEEACSLLPTNLAVKHHYAEIIALVIEESVDISISEINKAIERLDDVIIAHPQHAKYYCTQGRLIAATGDYNRGISSIKKALDMEEVGDKDSMVRIGQYNYYLLQVKMMMETHQVDGKINKFNLSFEGMEEKLDNIKTQYLEYLAFFSSILAFILTSVNIVAKIDDFNKGAGIILMFAGALIIVFVVFRMLLYFSSRIKIGVIKIIFCFIVGFLFIMCGWLIGNQVILQYLNL